MIADRRLDYYNPWWTDPSALDRHPLVQAWSESLVKHDPGPRLAFQHDDLVYSLRGPRRVGKTTFLMKEVQRLLRTVRPQNIFYYSFEVENNSVDVVNFIREYMERFKGIDGRRFVFLDEISSVRGWQKAIKKLWDMGEIAGSPSSSPDLTPRTCGHRRKACRDAAACRGPTILWTRCLPLSALESM